jgi:hypothetical protein
MKSSGKPSKKKPYRPPVLETYGNIRKITRVTGGTMGANDQFKTSNKTSP